MKKIISLLVGLSMMGTASIALAKESKVATVTLYYASLSSITNGVEIIYRLDTLNDKGQVVEKGENNVVTLTTNKNKSVEIKSPEDVNAKAGSQGIVRLTVISALEKDGEGNVIAKRNFINSNCFGTLFVGADNLYYLNLDNTDLGFNDRIGASKITCQKSSASNDNNTAN
jgi:hypothetical protein